MIYHDIPSDAQHVANAVASTRKKQSKLIQC